MWILGIAFIIDEGSLAVAHDGRFVIRFGVREVGDIGSILKDIYGALYGVNRLALPNEYFCLAVEELRECLLFLCIIIKLTIYN